MQYIVYWGPQHPGSGGPQPPSASHVSRLDVPLLSPLTLVWIYGILNMLVILQVLHVQYHFSSNHEG